jgi:hypothetical protein
MKGEKLPRGNGCLAGAFAEEVPKMEGLAMTQVVAWT